MITTGFRTRLRLLFAAALAAAAIALPAAQTFDGEPDPQPAAADLAIVGGCSSTGTRGRRCPARWCWSRATASSPSAAATS